MAVKNTSTVAVRTRPDKLFGKQSLADQMPDSGKYLKRLEHWLHRVSEWP